MNELNIVLMKKKKNKHNTRRVYIEKSTSKGTRRKYN